MQSTSSGQTLRERLISDMYALASYLMRGSNLGAFNAIAELDLSFTQIKTLCLMDLGTCETSVKGLAEAMNVSLPAMSRAVDGLYVRGFVDRCEDPEDRRMKRIDLTDSGRAVTNTLNEARLEGLREFLTSLDERETKALAQALELILGDRSDIAALRPVEKDGMSSLSALTCRDLLSSSADLVRAGIQTVELEEAPSDNRNGT